MRLRILGHPAGPTGRRRFESLASAWPSSTGRSTNSGPSVAALPPASTAPVATNSRSAPPRAQQSPPAKGPPFRRLARVSANPNFLKCASVFGLDSIPRYRLHDVPGRRARTTPARNQDGPSIPRSNFLHGNRFLGLGQFHLARLGGRYSLFASHYVDCNR